MNEKDVLEKLNELEVTDVDFDGKDVAYVCIEDNRDNRKLLVELGATGTEIVDMQMEKGALDITVFAFEKCGADWYQHGVGFGKNHQTIVIEGTVAGEEEGENLPAHLKITKVRPIAHHYMPNGAYIKYSCPVCEILGNKHQVHRREENCPLCNVNLEWDEN